MHDDWSIRLGEIHLISPLVAMLVFLDLQSILIVEPIFDLCYSLFLVFLHYVTCCLLLLQILVQRKIAISIQYVKCKVIGLCVLVQNVK